MEYKARANCVNAIQYFLIFNIKTMKTSIKTGLAAFMLLAISCRKEALPKPEVGSTQMKNNAIV
ncbi:hypothetical protein BH10BAC3_BH10BAC3_10080 [soil metagenome]